MIVCSMLAHHVCALSRVGQKDRSVWISGGEVAPEGTAGPVDRGGISVEKRMQSTSSPRSACCQTGTC